MLCGVELAEGESRGNEKASVPPPTLHQLSMPSPYFSKQACCSGAWTWYRGPAWA